MNVVTLPDAPAGSKCNRVLFWNSAFLCKLLSVTVDWHVLQVIADNMKSGGDLDPMVPGQKVTAVFGFCDIRQFTDTTEVLQEEIMEFVNTIARIVHMEVISPSLIRRHSARDGTKITFWST